MKNEALLRHNAINVYSNKTQVHGEYASPNLNC